jgi:hypothetical protein
MFSRHLIAAAALMAATCAAHADAITTTSSSIASDMSIVDTSTALTGANTGLASILAAPNTSSKLVLVRGVEGLYMLASRATASDVAANGDTTTAALLGSTTGSASDLIAVSDANPVVNADTPVLAAADVPEPATLALMLAGVLGAIGFTRARKQG